jgi:hypothetical protein
MGVLVIVPGHGRACQERHVCKAMKAMGLGRFLGFTADFVCTERHLVPITRARMWRALMLAGFCVMGGACASTGAVPRPFPVPGGSPPSGAPAARVDPAAETPIPVPPGTEATVNGYSLSSTALSLRGAPYRNGGADPGGFDCSGFVQYVFERHGVAMPRDVRRQFGVGATIEPDALEPGDLVFFSTVAPGASHVGIAIGGDQFVHAPSSSGVVRVERLSAEYWAGRFVGARRVN